jgi:integral membrane protein
LKHSCRKELVLLGRIPAAFKRNDKSPTLLALLARGCLAKGFDWPDGDRTSIFTAPVMMKNPIAVLRATALIEGVSFLVLLFLAMPLKYIWEQPMAVRVVGSAHGALWVMFCAMLLYVTMVAKWPLARAALLFMAALIPFGPWVVDRRMKQYEAEYVQLRGAVNK